MIKKCKGTHWVSLFIGWNTAVYCCILLGLNIFFKKYCTKSKINQLLTIYLAYNMMILLCVDFCCITFIEHMPAGKTVLDYTNSFFPNDKIIYKYFKD